LNINPFCSLPSDKLGFIGLSHHAGLEMLLYFLSISTKSGGGSNPTLFGQNKTSGQVSYSSTLQSQEKKVLHLPKKSK
jgi:hypothetical protein